MTQSTLRLPEKLSAFMGEYANKKGISMNALMIMILDEFKNTNRQG